MNELFGAGELGSSWTNQKRPTGFDFYFYDDIYF